MIFFINCSPTLVGETYVFCPVSSFVCQICSTKNVQQERAKYREYRPQNFWKKNCFNLFFLKFNYFSFLFFILYVKIFGRKKRKKTFLYFALQKGQYHIGWPRNTSFYMLFIQLMKSLLLEIPMECTISTLYLQYHLEYRTMLLWNYSVDQKKLNFLHLFINTVLSLSLVMVIDVMLIKKRVVNYFSENFNKRPGAYYIEYGS